MSDSLCIGQLSLKTLEERVVLFLQLNNGAGSHIDEHLLNNIKNTIRKQLSPKHVPALILPVQDIPVSNKI